MIFVAMLGVVSTILMTFNVSIPLAPSFLKFDIAEIPALFAGFFIGPVGGIGVIMVKIVIKIITQGTDTAFVGEMMNVMGSVCFVLPASLIYRWKHTKKRCSDRNDRFFHSGKYCIYFYKYVYCISVIFQTLWYADGCDHRHGNGSQSTYQQFNDTDAFFGISV